MQSKDTCTATIIGGCYKEICGLYNTCELKGSGIRALELFLELKWKENLSFYSCADKHIHLLESLYHRKNVNLILTKAYDVTFNYDHPFRMTNMFPRADVLLKDKKVIEAEDENVLIYGMVDANFEVKGRRVVYDPQTTAMMPLFSESGSEAEELIIVLNANEAKALSEKESLQKQRDVIFEKEHCRALIIKQGVKGATLFESKDDVGSHIPAYITPKVNSIGTGDVFTAAFAYQWFNGCTLKDAALYASKAVACFVAPHTIDGLNDRMNKFDYPILEYKDNKQIYLAGPFFSFTQRWLIGEFYKALLNENMTVFSPLHDVGIGDAREVTEPDLEGLRKSQVVLAVLDGLDSGTLFEVGYAIAHGKKVVAYVQNESRKALQMLEGTNCDIESDFTTAIYKTCWYAMQ